MQLKIKLLREGAALPKRATAESAGLDLCACLEKDLVLRPMEPTRIPTGIAVELSPGTAGFVYARSGLAGKHGVTLVNGVGVIDSDYRGELQVAMINLSKEEYAVCPGERIAQLVISPVLLPEPVEVQALSGTERGDGGFGSTGK